jgi:hypothetical protein
MNDDTERTLRTGLEAHRLSPEALARIHTAAHAEWRAAIVRPWWRRTSVAAAASVLLAMLAVGVYLLPAPAGPSAGTLVRAGDPGMHQDRGWRTDLALKAGDSVRAGHSYESSGGSLLALSRGGNLRIAPGSRIEILGAESVRLDRGELYVDIPPEAAASDLVVVTDSGEFRHVGTQFSLAVIDGGTRLRVREGTVQWRDDAHSSLLESGVELHIDRHGRITRRDIGTAGRSWAWMEALRPDVDIEGRPLSEFLEWVSRETGRRLVLADDEVRRLCEGTRMHGSVRGMSALEALAAVMAATPLRFDLAEGVIRVSLASVAPTARN